MDQFGGALTLQIVNGAALRIDSHLGDARRKKYAADTTFEFGLDVTSQSGPPTVNLTATIIGFMSLSVREGQ